MRSKGNKSNKLFNMRGGLNSGHVGIIVLVVIIIASIAVTITASLMKHTHNKSEVSGTDPNYEVWQKKFATIETVQYAGSIPWVLFVFFVFIICIVFPFFKWFIKLIS